MTSRCRTISPLVAGVSLLLACGTETGELPTGSRAEALRSTAAEAPRYSDWSEPVNLGPPVNTPFIEQTASISRDGLELYFTCRDCPTNVPGSVPGSTDVYVSTRPSVDAPWGPPQPLPQLNTISIEAAPRISIDGHRLFFSSDRSGGHGALDLYVSRRSGNGDHLSWGAPENLGAGVNTSNFETQPEPFEDDEGSSVIYYSVGPLGGDEIYVSAEGADGTYGPGAPVAELNSPAVDRQPAIRRDGLEIFFGSTRTGGLGGIDIWVSSRASTRDPWSPPVHVGAPVSGSFVDARPTLSFDGTMLYFQSTRAGAVGCGAPPCAFDLWVASRTKLRE